MASGGATRRPSRAGAEGRTRERLIATAGTVVDETAGRTVGGLHSQFDSKDELLVEAVHVHVAERVEQARSITASASFDDLDIRLGLGRLLAGAAGAGAISDYALATVVSSLFAGSPSVSGSTRPRCRTSCSDRRSGCWRPGTDPGAPPTRKEKLP